MSIVAVGINHKTAPVAVREKIAFNPDHLSFALQEMLKEVQHGNRFLLQVSVTDCLKR